ncbi:CHASE2 domain-containing protein [candidate division KSB1 bacterium]|nr:CHASE2 domain-containing protein [candidate division KSB1 bacterium]
MIKITKKSLQQVGIGLVLSMGMVSLILILRMLGVLDFLELKTLDWRFLLRGPLSGITAVEPIPKDSLDVVIVDLDDESWRLIPYKWPYPRQIWAQVVRNLIRAGARVIVFDIAFDSEDAQSASGDSTFAEAIREARAAGISIILGSKLVFEKTLVPPDYIQYPIDTLMNAGPETGLVGELIDPDGVTRCYIVYNMVSRDSLPHLSLGMKAVKEYLGYSTAEKMVQTEDYMFYGDLKIRSWGKATNNFLINYYGPPSNAGPPPPLGPWKTFNRYPLSNVLDDGEFDLKEFEEDTDWMEMFYPDGMIAMLGMGMPSPFKEKIVIIGLSVEIIFDVKQTPFYNYAGIQQLMPGMEMHTNAIQTILDSNYISRIGFWGEFWMLVFLSLLTYFFLAWLKPLKGGLVLLGVVLIFLSFSFGAFFRDFTWLFKKIFSMTVMPPGFGESVVVPVVVPIFGIVLTYVGNVLYQFMMEQREKRKIRGMFSTYMSPTVLKYLEDHPDAFRLTGEKRNATMFFSDVAGFTTISESLSAEELAVVLNKYLSPMTEILMSYDGYVDKYEGDAIMCDFGVPVEDPGHAWKGCWAALDQQERLVGLREEIKKDHGVEIYVRMGINSGVVSAGNMGSAQRFQYTVMGDAVNQASRFEGANKQYGTPIMIGEETYRQAKDKIEVRILDRLVVKGKAIPITVYELIGKNGKLDGEKGEVAEYFTKGINLYWQREWDEAIKHFQKALAIEPGDGPSKVFIERCQLYKENPPDENWQGEFVMKTK